MAKNSNGEDDLRFGGWRDWLLVLIGVPFVVAALIGAVALGIGRRGGRWTVPSITEALVLVAIAVVGGLAVVKIRR